MFKWLLIYKHMHSRQILGIRFSEKLFLVLNSSFVQWEINVAHRRCFNSFQPIYFSSVSATNWCCYGCYVILIRESVFSLRTVGIRVLFLSIFILQWQTYGCKHKKKFDRKGQLTLIHLCLHTKLFPPFFVNKNPTISHSCMETDVHER